MFSCLLILASGIAHATCINLMNTPEARIHQARARQILEDDTFFDRQIAFVGVSSGQLLKLVNEGVLNANQWATMPLRFLPIADRPALTEYAERKGVRIDAATARVQFAAARDHGWARTVIERMAYTFPGIGRADFLEFLVRLRAEVAKSRSPVPTLRHIFNATQWRSRSSSGDGAGPTFKDVLRMLGLPWEDRPARVANRLRFVSVRGAFQDLPVEAGVVLSFGPSVLERVRWDKAAAPTFATLRLEDVIAIQVFSPGDQEILDELLQR